MARKKNSGVEWPSLVSFLSGNCWVYLLPVVMVSWLFVYVQTHQIVHRNSLLKKTGVKEKTVEKKSCQRTQSSLPMFVQNYQPHASVLFLKLLFIFLNWNIVVLQCCVSFLLYNKVYKSYIYIYLFFVLVPRSCIFWSSHFIHVFILSLGNLQYCAEWINRETAQIGCMDGFFSHV